MAKRMMPYPQERIPEIEYLPSYTSELNQTAPTLQDLTK